MELTKHTFGKGLYVHCIRSTCPGKEFQHVSYEDWLLSTRADWSKKCRAGYQSQVWYIHIFRWHSDMFLKNEVTWRLILLNTKPSLNELLSSWHVGELSCFIITTLTEAGISVCLPPCYPHIYIIFPPPALPWCVLLSSSPFLCYALPGSSPGLKHRRRLASQWSNFTAVDADVKRSKRHLLFLLRPPYPPAWQKGY